MTLRQKLTEAFAIVLVLVGVQTAIAVLLLTQVVEESGLLGRPALSRMDDIAHAEADLLRLRSLEYSFLLSSDPQVRIQLGQEMSELRIHIPQTFGHYGSSQLDDARSASLAKILHDFDAYRESQLAVVAASERGDDQESLWEYLRFQPSFRALDRQVDALRNQEYLATEELRNDMIQAAVWARWPLGAIVLLIALVEFGVGLHLFQSIVQSLATLEDGARRIARGSFDEPVPTPPERELATLAEAINAIMVALATKAAENARLEAERLRLSRERMGLVVRAQEEERARVSRELHDQAGQGLTALQYGLSSVHHLAQEPVVAAEIAQLMSLAADTVRQIGALARDLRPSVLDDLGLVPALRSYVRSFSERIGIPVEFTLIGTVPRLSPEAETTVFRVVQEALTNVAKHARARRAWVELSVQDDQLTVRVRDDGQGFDRTRLAPAAEQRAARPGLGLAGIQERVQLLGGTFQIASDDGKGTQLVVSFSIQANARAPAIPMEEAIV